MFEAALPDPAALGWLLSAASGLSSSEWFDFFGLFFFFLTVVMAAFGKGGIGNDSLKRKRGKKDKWKEVECGMLPVLGSGLWLCRGGGNAEGSSVNHQIPSSAAHEGISANPICAEILL